MWRSEIAQIDSREATRATARIKESRRRGQRMLEAVRYSAVGRRAITVISTQVQVTSTAVQRLVDNHIL